MPSKENGKGAEEHACPKEVSRAGSPAGVQLGSLGIFHFEVKYLQ